MAKSTYFILAGFLIATVAAQAVTEAPVTTTAPPPPDCGPQAKGVCFDANEQFQKSTKRHSQHSNAFVVCESQNSITCMWCAGGASSNLFYSEKCSACMYEENDELNTCPPQDTTTGPIPTAPTTNPDYCDGKTDGNYADTQNPSFYYACVHGSTQHMGCATRDLVFIQTDRFGRCEWPKQEE